MSEDYIDSHVVVKPRYLNLSSTSFKLNDSIHVVSASFYSEPTSLLLISLKDYSVLRAISIDSIVLTCKLASKIKYARFNPDGSILAMSDSEVCIIHQHDLVRAVLPSDSKTEIQEYYIHYNKDLHPIYDPQANILRYGIYAYDQQATKRGHYASPYMERSFDLASGEWENIAVKRTIINLNYDYGFWDSYFRVVHEGQNIYSFETDPTFYVVADSIVSKVGGKSLADTIQDMLLPRKYHDNSTEKLRQLVSIGTYSTLRYNPTQHVFYRTFFHPIPPQRNDGLLNTLKDKPVSLQIFDTSLCLKAEILLDPHIYTSVVLPHPRGLAVYHKRTDADSVYRYTLVELEDR